MGPVVVTGAAGFVGGHLVEHLEFMGDEVIGLDRSNGPDLTDAAGWADLFADLQPEAIYHLGGWADVGASWRHPETAFEVNANGTLHVAEAAANNGVERLLLVSSADVYGLVSPTDLPLTESSPVQPRSPYGVSKEAAEAIGRRYNRATDLDVVIARPFNHIGPGQSTNFAVPAFAHRIALAEVQGGGDLTHGDLTAKRDLTDVRDVVRAYRLLMTAGTPGGTYNVCSGRSVAMADVLDELVAMAELPVECRIDPELLRPVELPVLEGSADRAKVDTGWEPTLQLTATLADVLKEARLRVSA